MVVGCPSIFNKLNSPLAKLPYKKFYKEVHKDIYLNLSVMWVSVSQILQELRFAQILVCVCLELCLMLCQTKNYSNVCSWECVFCSCWFPAHTPQGYKAPLTADELPFPFSTLTHVFFRTVWIPLLPGPLVFLHCFLPVSACCLTWGALAVQIHLHTKFNLAPNPIKAPFNHAEFDLIFNDTLKQIFFHSWSPNLQHQRWEHLLDSLLDYIVF